MIYFENKDSILIADQKKAIFISAVQSISGLISLPISNKNNFLIFPLPPDLHIIIEFVDLAYM